MSFSHAGLGQRLRQAGFSLHELLVTAVIAGVVGTGAVGFVSLMQDTRMTTAVNSLMGDLALARSTAITRNAMVTVRKSRDGSSCTIEAAWHEGWLVFADDNNNHDIDAGEMILHVQERLTGNMKLRYGEPGVYMSVTTPPAKPGPERRLPSATGAARKTPKLSSSTGPATPRVSAKTSEGKPLHCS